MVQNNADVIKAFNNEEEDIIPVSFWRHFADSEFIDALAHPEVIDLNVSGHKRYIHSINPDFVKTMTDGYFIDPSLRDRDPKSVDNLRIIQPLSEDHEWIQGQINLANNQKLAAGDKLTFYTLFSPLTILKWALIDHEKEDLFLADKRFADLYEKDSKAVEHALNVIGKDIQSVVKALSSSNIDGVYFSTQEIQDGRVKTFEFFKNVIEPVDTSIITEINKYFDINILHVCGFADATNHLEWFKNYQLQVINWSTHAENLSLKDGKKTL
ncbi:uroporphyrinogen decarboxylase [Paucilactobacillus suebicus]|uniref:uroporphyrinogen decarboxylase n=1 Tax=Paucilactobacillus suebicus TaxID=152335 RepID=UPI0002F45D4D|nr:uroporphyrinogen decarboxylase [Paucilactobacillus suebicus]